MRFKGINNEVCKYVFKKKRHRTYHIFQNIGYALNCKKHLDFNRLILGKCIYKHENLKLTNNFQINLQRSTNFLVDKMTTEDFIIPITFYYCCYCPNLRETVQNLQWHPGHYWSGIYRKIFQFSRASQCMSLNKSVTPFCSSTITDVMCKH